MSIPVAVIIPALDEERSLPLVLAALGRVTFSPADEAVRPELSGVIVVDNGSRDATARVASEAGASVVSEPRRGYGRACLAGLAHLTGRPPGIVVFLDADYSDDPTLLPALVEPIARGESDLVLGSRLMGRIEPGALPPQARYGNRLSVSLIRLLYGFAYTDLGPFRAVRYSCLMALGMSDPAFGWTAEMQVKALRAGLRVKEVPVPYRRRIGSSKITGTLQGTVRAGATIVWTIVKHRFGAAALSRAGGSS